MATALTQINGYAHVAAQYGFEEAVFLDSIIFWYRTNKANNRNFRDGRWWTYNSIKAFEEVFPWWSTKQIVDAEKKIKAFADGHKTGNFACVTPVEADRILREFYGLGSRRLPDPSFVRGVNDGPLREEPGPAAGGELISLLDFL